MKQLNILPDLTGLSWGPFIPARYQSASSLSRLPFPLQRLHDLVGDDGFRLLVAQLQDKDQLTQHRRPLGALAGVITHDRAVQHVRTHVVLIEQGCDVGGCDCNNKRVVISKGK